MPTTIRPKIPPAVPPPAPPPSPPPASPPPPPAKLGSFGNASIDQWDEAFLAAVAAVKKKGLTVEPLFLKAMMAVESGNDGNYPASKCRSDGSCGPMQIKQQFHQWRCPECDFKTVPGQIELAAHIIGDTMLAKGLDEYGALLDTYFPTDDIINGTTQAQYAARVKDLVAQMGGTTPVERDLIDVIVGGAPYTDDYGFKAPTDLPYYAYFVGHGGNSNQHTGIDVTGPVGEPLYSPINGTVVCAGTSTTVAGSHESSCAAFNYTLGAAGSTSGRFEIEADDGKRTLILGHVLRSVVPLGTRVKVGDHVADMGGQNGPHCHVEARVWANGTYTITDPRKTFGRVVAPIPVERVPYNFNPEAEPPPNLFTVRADKKLTVYQRADPKAAVLDTIAKGDEFQAVAIIPGNDKKQWFLGVYNGRVPVDGTTIL